MNQVPVLDAVKRMKDYELLHCAFRAKGAVGDKKKIKAGREEGEEEIPHMPKTMRGAAEDKKEAEGSMPADWSVDQLVSPSFFSRETSAPSCPPRISCGEAFSSNRQHIAQSICRESGVRMAMEPPGPAQLVTHSPNSTEKDIL